MQFRQPARSQRLPLNHSFFPVIRTSFEYPLSCCPPVLGKQPWAQNGLGKSTGPNVWLGFAHAAGVQYCHGRMDGSSRPRISVKSKHLCPTHDRVWGKRVPADVSGAIERRDNAFREAPGCALSDLPSIFYPFFSPPTQCVEEFCSIIKVPFPAI